MLIGKNIRLFRIHRGKTQIALAHEVGISVNYLSQIENGRKSPSPVTIKKIVQKLDIPESYLFFSEKPTQSLPNNLTDILSLLEDIVAKVQDITKKVRAQSD